MKRWFFAVVSGFALVVLGACGANVVGQLLTDAGEILTDGGNANAQVPSACKKWEVQRLYYPNLPTQENTSSTTSIFAGGALSIPDGWEPFGGTAYGSGTQYLIVRRCVL